MQPTYKSPKIYKSLISVLGFTYKSLISLSVSPGGLALKKKFGAETRSLALKVLGLALNIESLALELEVWR